MIKILVIFFLVTLAFTSCSDKNILDTLEYTAYEDEAYEFEDLSQDYIVTSKQQYDCNNISNFLHSALGKIEVKKQWCSESNYKGNTIISFVYYKEHYESFPSLGYKILILDESKGYIDYILPGDDDNIILYSSLQKNIIDIAYSQGAEFPNEKWSELYNNISESLKKDFSTETGGLWIYAEHKKLNSYIQKNFN